VPIVVSGSFDPVGAGLVASLSHPGGNITGFIEYIDPEFETKRHAAKRRFERVDRRSCYAAHMNMVRRTNKHDAPDGLRTIAKRRKCCRGGRARINVAGMWHDERFGNVLDGYCDVGEEVRDLLPQTIRVTGIKLACYCRWPDHHVSSPLTFCPDVA